MYRTDVVDSDELTASVVQAIEDFREDGYADVPLLHEGVDTDAMKTLFQHAGPDMKVKFTYKDTRVTVTGDGEIRLED